MSACSRVLSAAALTASMLVASAAPLAAHEDPRIGFSFKEPHDWTEIPQQQNEIWVVAQYLSDKKYFYTDPDLGWTFSHQPTLEVIAFLDEVINRKDVEKDEGDESEVKVRLIEPYHDYKDFLKRTYTGGGYYFDVEDVVEQNGKQVEVYEIKVEKHSRTGPKRIVTWVFPIKAGKVAVQIEVLEDEYDKLTPLIRKVMKSFEEIERTEDFDLSDRTADYISISSLWELDPEQRKIRRQEMERTAWENVTANLPEGWEAMEVDHVNVVTRGDKKHAKEVVDHVHAIQGWLEGMFPDYGAGEYVRMPIVRICKDIDEYRAFRKGTWSFGGMGLEIVTYEDSGGAASIRWDYINDRARYYWFFDRDTDCYQAMPQWLQFGVRQILQDADVKNGKLRLRQDEWERDALRDVVKEGSLMSAKEVMLMGSKEIGEANERKDPRPATQATALVRFFLEGAASKNRKTKHMLDDYLANLHAVIVEIEQEDKAEVDEPKPTTEAEEEELQKRRQERWYARQARILQEVLDRTTADWSDRDWSSFESAYERSMN